MKKGDMYAQYLFLFMLVLLAAGSSVNDTNSESQRESSLHESTLLKQGDDKAESDSKSYPYDEYNDYDYDGYLDDIGDDNYDYDYGGYLEGYKHNYGETEKGLNSYPSFDFRFGGSDMQNTEECFFCSDGVTL